MFVQIPLWGAIVCGAFALIGAIAIGVVIYNKCVKENK